MDKYKTSSQTPGVYHGRHFLPHRHLVLISSFSVVIIHYGFSPKMLLGRAGGRSSLPGFRGPQGWTTDTGVSETSHSSWIKSEFCSSRAETLQTETDGPKSWGTSQRRLRRKRRGHRPGFRRDQNTKPLQACKQRRPQCGCCNVGGFIRTGQCVLIKRTVKNT